VTHEPKTVTFTKDEPIGFERTADDKLIISGYSIHTGIFQNQTVEIPYSELSNIAESLKGQKFLKNHNAFESEAVIGKIIETKIGLDKTIGKKGVKYKGVIRDAELESKIQDGFLDNVSIGFELKPECSVCGEDFRYCEHWFDEAHVIARDCKCYEQSIVPFGADSNTTIEPGASFSHDNDFTAQFNYKDTTSDTGQWKHNSGSTSAPMNEQEFDFAPIQSIPAYNITYTFNAPKDDGDKMVDENKELEGRIEELEAEIIQKDATIQTLTEERDELASDKSELEGKVSELEGTVSQLEETITAYEDAEAEAEEAEKLAAIREIVELEELEGEEAEAREKVLSEFDMPALEEIKAAKSTVKVVAAEEPKIGQFHAQKSEEAMPEKIDLKDREQRKLALGQMFNMKFRKRE
jgi:hypothetical protein